MQTTSNILMIRPAAFTYNEQTAASNAFQNIEAKATETQHKACDEFDHMVELLDESGITVYVAGDTEEPQKPDAIFPNNWISFHEEGLVGLYPMQAENRRLERRPDIVSMLAEKFVVNDLVDFSAAEKEGQFLEGTGSMVLDRVNKICYACFSPRTHTKVLEQFAKTFGYNLCTFTARDVGGLLIYHTNVVMCVGEKFIAICMEAISSEEERAAIRNSTTKEIIGITLEQLHHFAGNMLELKSKTGEQIVVMSEQAFSSLLQHQVAAISKYARILPVPLYTIEAAGGGSARCMMAEIFLPARE